MHTRFQTPISTTPYLRKSNISAMFSCVRIHVHIRIMMSNGDVNDIRTLHICGEFDVSLLLKSMSYRPILSISGPMTL